MIMRTFLTEPIDTSLDCSINESTTSSIDIDAQVQNIMQNLLKPKKKPKIIVDINEMNDGLIDNKYFVSDVDVDKLMEEERKSIEKLSKKSKWQQIREEYDHKMNKKKNIPRYMRSLSAPSIKHRTVTKSKTPLTFDPRPAMELRHREIEEKRKRRKLRRVCFYYF